MAVKKKGKLSSLQNKAQDEKAADNTPVFSMPDSFSQIWLAGLGALAKAQAEGPRLLESLVAEGSRVKRGGKIGAKLVKDSVTSAKELAGSGSESLRRQTSEGWDNLENIFRDRVARAMTQLGAPTAATIDEMSAEIASLKKRLSALEATQEKTPKPRARATSGKNKPGPD